MDIEQLLSDGNTIQVKANGYSMYPLIVPDRDMVIIAPFQSDGGCSSQCGLQYSKDTGSCLKRGEVVLYRRNQSILVLHRIWKVKKDGLYMVGDNQTQVEGPLRYDQVRGKMVGFVRKGREVSVRHPVYRMYAAIWLWMRPVRHRIAAGVHFFKQRLFRENGKIDE